MWHVTREFLAESFERLTVRARQAVESEAAVWVVEEGVRRPGREHESPVGPRECRVQVVRAGCASRGRGYRLVKMGSKCGEIDHAREIRYRERGLRDDRAAVTVTEQHERSREISAGVDDGASIGEEGPDTRDTRQIERRESDVGRCPLRLDVAPNACVLKRSVDEEHCGHRVSRS